MAVKRQARKRTSTKPNLVLEKSAGAVVYDVGPPLRYLLILSTYWEFPKGQVEPEESETAAAVREVREETGLEVTLDPGFRSDITYFYRRGSNLIKKQVIYFLGRASTTGIQLSWEHKEAEWLTYDPALARLKYQNARQVLQAANDWLAGMGVMGK